MGLTQSETQSSHCTLEVVRDLAPNYFSNLISHHPPLTGSTQAHWPPGCFSHTLSILLSQGHGIHFFHCLENSPSPPQGSHGSSSHFPHRLLRCLLFRRYSLLWPAYTKIAPACHSLPFTLPFFNPYDCLIHPNLLVALPWPSTRRYTPLDWGSLPVLFPAMSPVPGVVPDTQQTLNKCVLN